MGVWKVSTRRKRNRLFCAQHFLPALCHARTDRVPGDAASKLRRVTFCDKVRGLLPSPDALMEQLAAFPGDSVEDFVARRDILMSAMSAAEP